MGGRVRLRWPDAVGLGLVLAWLLWVGVSGTLNGRTVPPGSTFLVAPLVLIGGVALGRLAGGAARADTGGAGPGPRTWWVHVILLGLVTALLPGVRLWFAPGPRPLGYANANAAAAIQVLALCGLALLDNAGRERRLVLATMAAASAYAVVHHGSVAGTAVAIPVALAVALMALRPARRRRWPVAVGVLSLVAGVAALLRVASLQAWPEVLLRALDPVRREMWRVALSLWRDHPLTGGGAGSYVEVNPYGHDTDTVAAHSSLLQTGSELGLVGVGLLALLVLAGFAVGARGRPAHGLLAAAAWTALWLHSLVDHLFDYPGVPLLAGIVIGWAGAVPQASSRPGDHLRPR